MNTDSPLTIAGVLVIAIALLAVETVVRHRHNGDDPR